MQGCAVPSLGIYIHTYMYISAAAGMDKTYLYLSVSALVNYQIQLKRVVLYLTNFLLVDCICTLVRR